MRDPETGNHILRTQGYMRTLAEYLRGNPRFAAVLRKTMPSWIPARRWRAIRNHG